jgi:hypothetical protein
MITMIEVWLPWGWGLHRGFGLGGNAQVVEFATHTDDKRDVLELDAKGSPENPPPYNEDSKSTLNHL